MNSVTGDLLGGRLSCHSGFCAVLRPSHTCHSGFCAVLRRKIPESQKYMKILILGLLIVLFLATPSWAAGMPKREVKKGNILYNKDKFEEALKEYEKAFLKAPDSDVVNFDIANALYKTGDYKAALNHFEKALVSEDEELEKSASFNIGNAKYKYGMSKEKDNIEEAVDMLKQSLRHYERALELDAEDEDALFNHELVQKELARLMKKLKKEKKEQKESQGKKNEEDNKEKQADSAEEDKEKESDPSKSFQEEEPKEEKKSENQAAQEESSEELSEKEAMMLLKEYIRDEEPKTLYKEKLPKAQPAQTLKDW